MQSQNILEGLLTEAPEEVNYHFNAHFMGLSDRYALARVNPPFWQFFNKNIHSIFCLRLFFITARYRFIKYTIKDLNDVPPDSLLLLIKALHNKQITRNEKIQFAKDFTTEKILAINNCNYWQLVFSKLLDIMGVPYLSYNAEIKRVDSDLEQQFVCTDNLEVFKKFLINLKNFHFKFQRIDLASRWVLSKQNSGAFPIFHDDTFRLRQALIKNGLNRLQFKIWNGYFTEHYAFKQLYPGSSHTIEQYIQLQAEQLIQVEITKTLSLGMKNCLIDIAIENKSLFRASIRNLVALPAEIHELFVANAEGEFSIPCSFLSKQFIKFLDDQDEGGGVLILQKIVWLSKDEKGIFGKFSQNTNVDKIVRQALMAAMIFICLEIDWKEIFRIFDIFKNPGFQQLLETQIRKNDQDIKLLIQKIILLFRLFTHWEAEQISLDKVLPLYPIVLKKLTANNYNSSRILPL